MSGDIANKLGTIVDGEMILGAERLAPLKLSYYFTGYTGPVAGSVNLVVQAPGPRGEYQPFTVDLSFTTSALPQRRQQTRLRP